MRQARLPLPAIDRLWLGVYGMIFLIHLVFLVIRLPGLVSPYRDFVATWELSKWMVNYQAGFVRRGLIGEILFRLHGMGLHPVSAAGVASISAYFLFALLLYKYSRNRVPRWSLFSTLLIAGPLYARTYSEPDVLILLVAFVAALVLFRSSLGAAQRYLLVNSLSVLGLLSHETYLLFGALPLMAVTALQYLSLENRRSRAPLRWLSAIRAAIIRHFSVLPTTLVLVIFSGTDQHGRGILASWRSAWLLEQAYPENPVNLWATFGSSLSEAASVSLHYLGSLSYGIPSWIILCIVMVVSFSIVALLLDLRGREAADLFLSLAPFQAVLVAIMMLIACDFGRWIWMGVLSAFAISMAACRANQKPHALGFARRLNDQLLRVSTARWFQRGLPVLLLFWGVDSTKGFFLSETGTFQGIGQGFNLAAFVFASPLGSIYFGFRQLGLIDSLGVFNTG